MGRLIKLLRALNDHLHKKNEILDIFYNGLTDASSDFLDSCAGCVLRETTVGKGQKLLNNKVQNADDWTLPKPPRNLFKRREVFYSSVLNICKKPRDPWKKGIKTRDVKNLPPVEEIHGLEIPIQVVEVNYLSTFNEGDIPYNKTPSQQDEFDNYIVK